MECSPIPVGFGAVIKGWEDYGENNGKVITHQIYQIFVVPVQKCALGYLKMLAFDTPCQLRKESHLDLLEFLRVCYVKDLFNFV